MSIPTLVCTGGVLDGQSFEITTQGLRIGRDPANEVHIPESDVSRAHARVVLHNGAVWVQDAGSRNGVFVNDARVTEHKQLSPGDRLMVGGHAFTVELQDPLHEHSVSVSLSAVSEPEKKWRIWPFALVLLLLVGCLGLISMRSGGNGSTGGEGVEEAPAYSLSKAMGSKDKEEAGGGTELTDALATTSGGGRESWPKPPAGATAEDLVEKAHNHYSAQRRRDALEHYQMALQLDPTCELCEVRIERLDKEITDEVNEQFEAGMRYYDSLQYQQAVNAFEMVLLLEPNADTPVHQQSKEYLEDARKKVSRQY